MDDVDPVKRRKRGKVLEVRILEAAEAELAEHGWTDFRISRVAVRAATGKGSIYSRWPNKVALISATGAHMAGAAKPGSSGSGDLRTDLLHTLRSAAVTLGGPTGSVMRAMLTEGSTPARLEGRRDKQDIPAQTLVDAVARARESGQLGGGDVPVRVLHLGLTVVQLHYLMHDALPDDDELVEIVDEMWLPLIERAAGVVAK